jgi:hypothetical protein
LPIVRYNIEPKKGSNITTITHIILLLGSLNCDLIMSISAQMGRINTMEIMPTIINHSKAPGIEMSRVIRKGFVSLKVGRKLQICQEQVRNQVVRSKSDKNQVFF